MKRLDNAHEIPAWLRGGAVALGYFDGFHRGHQAVIARARARAGAESRPLIIATFEPHAAASTPNWRQPPRLTTLDQCERLFNRAGADAMFVFDAKLRHPSPEGFVRDWVAGKLGAAAIFTGDSFTFGEEREGDLQLLTTLNEQHGIGTHSVASVSDTEGVVSSIRIREALRSGDCLAATHLLSRPFAIEGIVQHGRKLGRTIGFPTANLFLDQYVRPKYGVYVVRGRLPGGRVIDGVANFGIRPMMEPPEEIMEPHFFDFTGDLYDQIIEVELIQYLRPEMKLSGLDELKDWISRDCDAARKLLSETPHYA